MDSSQETVCSTGLATGTDGSRAGRTAAATAIADLPTARVDFCHLFCSPQYDYEAVIGAVRSVIGPDAELIGCSAAGPFAETETCDAGVTLALVTSDSLRFVTGLGTGLEASVSGAVREAIDGFPSSVDGYPYRTAITLHDGLCGVGERLGMVTQQKLGPNVGVVGGAASDAYDHVATHVFRNGTVAEDAVAIALVASKTRLPTAVGHGHEPLSEPVTVTAADGCTVSELDGRPAYEVWKDAVRDHARAVFDLEIDEVSPAGKEIREIMGAYELGIDQGGTYKIRWPRVTDDDGALHFAVAIPEGTVLRVTYGSPENQIRSARQTVRNAVADANAEIAGAFVYDCACREIILGDRFPEAVDAMSDELEAPLCGYETYGETCLQLGQHSGFHNTSTVVVLLPR